MLAGFLERPLGGDRLRRDFHRFDVDVLHEADHSTRESPGRPWGARAAGTRESPGRPWGARAAACSAWWAVGARVCARVAARATRRAVGAGASVGLSVPVISVSA
ncbi:hypothetical protein GCM10025872_19610 [Barrientosiimonas endolithica]|uniref:Uncharacterized protein n=1 Tax=Barrientosiimonas endolithica TaxID=1535208 RepID=A0ABN6YLF3_9MICO|nr:hypothetical protein GCM10025872_19610 [Barrientosiimonas endolithica]